ncbi:MAG: MurR/RpiR family transcriptional regulator, partial [Bacillota bacterium]
MENKNIISIIRENYDDMSKSFKKVADYILSNTQEVSLYNNMKTLAEKSGVSQSTIIRFSKYLNLEGTGELQEKLLKNEEVNLKTKQGLLNRIKGIAESDDYTEKQNRLVNYLLKNYENIGTVTAIAK